MDEQHSFEGKYSLHVKLFEPATIYLMNKVAAHPGKFSFRIKNLKQTKLSLTRYDYKPDGKLAYPDFVYYFCLADQSVHSFSVNLKQEDFLGNDSLFLLTGKNSEFLLDSISYCEE